MCLSDNENVKYVGKGQTLSLSHIYIKFHCHIIKYLNNNYDMRQHDVRCSWCFNLEFVCFPFLISNSILVQVFLQTISASTPSLLSLEIEDSQKLRHT